MDPRLKHLNDAAHLLQSTSPSTAAYLQARIEADLWDSILTNDSAATRGLNRAQQRTLHLARTRLYEICSACGHMYSRLAVTKLQADQALSKQGNPFVACQACFRTTRLVPEPVATEERPAKKPKQDVLSAKPGMPASPMSKDLIAKAAPATTMAKKQKGRRGNSLSAMLAKSKQDAAGNQAGFGLDLMDLMKGT